ncbi:hypothetical protein Pla123a_45550 [Posidoniimonas polymericola]|uniref:PEP-CTERM protein-sorting domain-containing protein n=1 Tax=Posidoniimonas polymericola TaxID=2528002 RepID=A0A5C5XUE3_9BACT|nr:hypothetical protein [Posidoniimonas polymericola]TWT66857.1 hypothetical protein Pla123a_45550 [Posidoniimonas polymericola]
MRYLLRSFAALVCVAAAATSSATPTLQFANDTGSSVTLQVVTDDSSSIGAEVAIEINAGPTLELTGATVNTAFWDYANPGDNPFIPGAPVGGDSFGLWTDFALGQVFAAFGSGFNPMGVHDFITIDYTGSGSLMAEGFLAQNGVLGAIQTANVDLVGVPEPAALALGLLPFVALAGRRNRR